MTAEDKATRRLLSSSAEVEECHACANMIGKYFSSLTVQASAPCLGNDEILSPATESASS
jgi:hypothetical protein